MMNGCTPSPMIITPLANPHSSATTRHVPRPSSTVTTDSIGPAARSTIAIATPASAYTAPTERSIPPAMITSVAPTPMIAKALASVAI